MVFKNGPEAVRGPNGLESWVRVSGPAGIVGGRSECPALNTAHCSRVCVHGVCVCSLLCVCT